jgi:hypothetical protein
MDVYLLFLVVSIFFFFNIEDGIFSDIVQWRPLIWKHQNFSIVCYFDNVIDIFSCQKWITP